MISGTNKYNEIEMHHSIEVKDRAKMIITGVNDVSEFSDNAVKLKTNLGGLMIRGNNLSINKLNTPNGDVEINGSVDFIGYQTKQKGGILTKLLK